MEEVEDVLSLFSYDKYNVSNYENYINFVLLYEKCFSIQVINSLFFSLIHFCEMKQAYVYKKEKGERKSIKKNIFYLYQKKCNII